MRVSDEEELEAAASEVPACIFSWTAPADVLGRPIARSVRRISNAARAARPRVLGALVEEQQRVAAELQQAATLCVRHGEECRERRVHDLGDLLRARSSKAREALRHRGEPGDVDEGDGSLDLAPRRFGIVPKPLDGQPRDERDEVGRRLCARI